MLVAQPVPALSSNANSTRKKLTQGADSFARALDEGLIDVAFSFDGAFRPIGSMSLAERAAYGLRSNGQRVTHVMPSAEMHGGLAILSRRRVVSERAPRPLNASPRAVDRNFRAFAVPPAIAVEKVRRGARPRHASTSDAPLCRARQDQAAGCPVARIRASVGFARIDVVVAGGGRLASVMQWMR